MENILFHFFTSFHLDLSSCSLDLVFHLLFHLLSSLFSLLFPSSLSSCLVLSSFVFSSLSLSLSLSLSVSVSVWCCGRVAVVCCGVLWCVVVCCGVLWCVMLCGTLKPPVCPLKTCPCAPAPRPHVSKHATQGDVLNVHTEAF